MNERQQKEEAVELELLYTKASLLLMCMLIQHEQSLNSKLSHRKYLSDRICAKMRLWRHINVIQLTNSLNCFLVSNLQHSRCQESLWYDPSR